MGSETTWGLARARLRVRGDAGFYGKRVIELLDGQIVSDSEG